MPVDVKRGTPTETYDAPESNHETDRETIGAVDDWIGSIHPDGCEKAAAAIFPIGLRYMSTSTRLAAHLITVHDKGVQLLTLLHASSLHYEPEKIGLDEAIRTKQKSLTEELIQEAQELEGRPRGPVVAGLVVRHMDDEHFDRVWSALWEGGLAEKAPRTAGRILRAAGSSEGRADYVSDLLNKSLDEVFHLVPDELAFTLLYFKQVEECRDWALESLLTRHGVKAARIILATCEHAPHTPSCVPDATRLLIANEPENRLAAVGAALCLEADPDFAVSTIARWANREYSDHVYDQFLVFKVQSTDQRDLFHALASSALEEPDFLHPTLARRHHYLVSDVGVVAEWIESSLEEAPASRYAAALVVDYLSTPPRGVPSDALEPLKEEAHELHERYGKRSKEDVLRGENLTDSGLRDYDLLVAIALAKDVEEPFVKPDSQVVLRNIKSFPYTHRALGGDALDRALTNGELPCCASVYARDLAASRAEDAVELMSSKIEPGVFERREQHRQLQEAARQKHEERFRNIITAGYEFTPSKSEEFRRDPYTWTEIRVLERLIPFFNVTVEPEDIPGLDGKNLDFLLRCDDGELILEVATIGRKPEDVREGVKMSSGGQAKKTLQNKWREQFGECKGDIELPVVIAIQPQWAHDLGFDILNSLYGPQTVSYVLHTPSQQVVEEGTGRDADKAFFALEGIDCISGVAAISAEDLRVGPLRGELFRPLESSLYPLSPRMWVRLRTALYGPRPMELVHRMSRIPDITENEAEALVDYGVDDHSFFAADKIPYRSGIPISEERYQDLVENARHLQTLVHSGRISDLRIAEGVDLRPLYEKGIFLIKQLLKTDEPPEGFSASIWRAMQEEAARFLKGD